MGALLREALLQGKALLGGASSTSLNGVIDILPQSLINAPLFAETVNVAGVGIPSFLLYLFFFSE